MWPEAARLLEELATVSKTLDAFEKSYREFYYEFYRAYRARTGR
jgi:hypothetical protein